MEMYDENDENIVMETVCTDITCTHCDTPAAQKVGGLTGHSSDLHCCTWCKCTLLAVNKWKFPARDDFEMLKQKSTILKNHGVRWSALDWIPGWRPALQMVLDFMHCIYLGVVAFFWTQVLFAAHMFPGVNGANSVKQRFEDVINAIQWLSHITCLLKNLGKNQSFKKADEWCCLLTVTPVVLWYAWHDPNNTIPDTASALSLNEQVTIKHSRHWLSLFNAVLFLCVALIDLGVELTINHHLATHFPVMIKVYSPVYGWWLFAFE
ncbi:hypothetical protein GYMLUDRAFT_66805 [Collybiopsis luxurians FD-317 M1]|nr:hypothetical protein GYMLUDRAFT_66805 [Collybiopsis luxurians FD-317 M1]